MLLIVFTAQVSLYVYVGEDRKINTLRKVRGPYLFNNPASDPSTTKGTSSEVANSF